MNLPVSQSHHPSSQPPETDPQRLAHATEEAGSRPQPLPVSGTADAESITGVRTREEKTTALNPLKTADGQDCPIPLPKDHRGQKGSRREEPRELDNAPVDPKSRLLDESLEYCQISQDFWQKGDLDNALDALDQAYSLILRIDAADNSKLLQQKEDLRFTISKRILEIYASRNIVVNGNHKAIPMVINEHVQAEIDSFTTGRERDFFIEAYQRSGKYRQTILAALEEAGLPKELAWLPLIESGFKVNALSKARALGLWQFIPSTGYKFGLKRDMYIDERLDPYKSTAAAIGYLKELHQIFGDWATVLAGYNCGENRVLRVIRDQNVNYLDNFWDLYQRLPQETARYVPRFLATLHIVNNLEKFGMEQACLEPPLAFDTVSVERQVHIRDLAEKLDISESAMKELNPELRYDLLPAERYTLRVPSGKAQMLMAAIDEVPESSHPPVRAFDYHRVKPGETIASIARRYNTGVQQIAQANNISKQKRLASGRIIKIPQEKTFAHAHVKLGKTEAAKVISHSVKSGDSLYNIAKRYNTTTREIQQLNNMASVALSIGQTLKIPAPAAQEETRDVPKPKFHEVKRGESPFIIAKQHDIPLEKLLRLNRLSPKSKIQPGQKLSIQ